MTRGDTTLGLSLAGIAAITLLLFSDDPFSAAATAVVACLLIGVGASWFARWYDESRAGKRSGRAARAVRRVARFSVESLSWPARALVFITWWALAAAAVMSIADMLVLREDTARVIFFVLVGLGALVFFVGEFANRHERPRGSGRPSQSS